MTVLNLAFLKRFTNVWAPTDGGGGGTATTIRDLLLPAEQRFGLPWAATGAASITPGTSAAITASGGKLSMPGIAVTPGQQLTYSVTSTQPVTISWEAWGGGAQSGSGLTTGTSLPIIVPAGSTELVLSIEYAAAAATLSGVSLVDAMPSSPAVSTVNFAALITDK